MIPEWVLKILESGGLWGAITFVLLSTVIAETLYIRSMQAKADKVYGYRLAERDTLNKALTDVAAVLADMLEATKDRNELTAELAELIAKQVHAFELLKASIIGQYDNIKDHNTNTADAIRSMAEAIRTLTAMVNESRYAYGLAISEIKNTVNDNGEEVRREVRSSAAQVVTAISQLLGNEVTIVQRRKARVIVDTRPKGAS